MCIDLKNNVLMVVYRLLLSNTSVFAETGGLIFLLALTKLLLDRIARTTYVDAVYCCRTSSVVCRSVCLSVCHTSEPCKKRTAKPIEIPFGLRTRIGPGNHVLDGGQLSPWEGEILRGKGRPIVKYRDSLRSSMQKRLKRSRHRLN